MSVLTRTAAVLLRSPVHIVCQAAVSTSPQYLALLGGAQMLCATGSKLFGPGPFCGPSFFLVGG